VVGETKTHTPTLGTHKRDPGAACGQKRAKFPHEKTTSGKQTYLKTVSLSGGGMDIANVSSEIIMTEIGKALDAVAANSKPLHAIFIKDFKFESLKNTRQFLNFGYSEIKVEPNMIIQLKPEWKNFEDYKNILKSKYRVKANKADSKSSSLETRLFCDEDFETYKHELQALYQNTIDKASFNAQVLNLDTYSHLSRALKENFIVKGYFLENRLIGFLTALVNDNKLDAHFIGLDYELNKSHAIYPRILNDYVRIGIEKQVSSINLGRTASEIKTTIGASPLELSCYIKHKNPFLNSLVKPFFRRIRIKGFKQHSPFK
jgi:predicted N-acyltransferase